MKTLFSIILLATVHFSYYSQISDTCEYVSQNYSLGGLYCSWGVLSSEFPIDAYQWVNCDDMYEPFVGDTIDLYQSSYNGNVALIIEALGCVDTSYCHNMCTWGIKEHSISKREIVRGVDLTGRDTEEKPNRLLIYMYSDGTKKKVFRTE